MPDIAMRFHKDMLVISAPIDAALKRRGHDPEQDRPILNLLEPDTIEDVLRIELMAGAHCLVANTVDLTWARLARVDMENDAQRLAHEAINVVQGLKPQHILAEIGPCGLPLDPSSKASLNEHRAQYAAAVRALADETFDALFLNGFTNATDLKCALMGAAQVSAQPVFASVVAQGAGEMPDGTELVEAAAMAEEYGAAVVGFETSEPIDAAVAYVRQMHAVCDAPLLSQLRVTQHNPRQGGPTADNPYYCPDAMEQAAVKLYGAGVQFLRATGEATPAYTGALEATVHGLDVCLTSPDDR